MNNVCPLCLGESKVFYQFKTRLYHQCNKCYGIFVDKSLVLAMAAEKSRYEEHINDVNDKGYQEFVSPISSAILRDFTMDDEGLDFGAGSGPVISKVLKDNDFQIEQYDPFFQNFPALLNEQYDYIACCEVIEHFHNPHKDFALLKNLLNKDGKLYCMTSIYDEGIDFHDWNYKDDKTHVFIYHRKTLHWIKEEFRFSNITINDRLITYFN